MEQWRREMTDSRRESVVTCAWWLFFCVTSTVWCLQAAQHLSATFDEPLYFRLGLDHWRNGLIQPMMRYGVMPLPLDLQALPLYLIEQWRGLPVDFERDFAWGLSVFRAGTMWFWWVLLFYTFRIGRSLGGVNGGRLAVALVAWEPNLLAHATFATADVAVTACLMGLWFEYARSRTSHWGWRLILPGVLYGVAMLAKASALAYGPMVMLAIEAVRLRQNGELFQKAPWIAWFREMKAIGGLGLLIVVLYCGSDWNVEPSFIEWAKTLPPGALHDAMLWISQNLTIFSNGFEGPIQQIKHNIRGHATYLFGREYHPAIWYYFPAAFAVKVTLGFLILPIAIAISRRQALWNWALLASVLLLLFSVTFRVQIGIRFLLPMFALMAAGLGAAVVLAGHKTALRALALCVVAWNGWGVLSMWPNAITFSNELFGGHTRTHLHLSDSNCDWGQGLPELRQWAESHRVPELDVWYFGTDPAVDILPLRELPLHRFAPGVVVPDVVHGRVVAVSLTLLYGSYSKGLGEAVAAIDFFKSRSPLDRTSTFLIYDFREATSHGSGGHGPATQEGSEPE